MMPYSDFLRAHAGSEREAFLSLVDVPHLLLPAITPDGEIPQFFTVAAREASPAARWLHGVSILPVKNRPDGPFSHMITLGRAENVDLVVPHSAVSKFHLYLRRLDHWMLCDAESSNGTRVDGRDVPAHEGVPLRSGATITLGDVVEMEFLEPPELYDRVTEEARALQRLSR